MTIITIKFIEALGRGLGYGLALVAGTALVGYGAMKVLPAVTELLEMIPGTTYAARRAECDRAVQILRTTDHPVDLDRARYLIDKLDCNIPHRLPQPGDTP